METNQMIERLKGEVLFSCLLEEKMKSLSIEEALPVRVGGRVTHVFDMSAIRFAREDEEQEDAIIEDVYLTIDDGLGTINVAIHHFYYKLMLEDLDSLLGRIVLFEGDAVRISRDLVDPKTKITYPNPERPYDLRVYAKGGHMLA